MAAALIQFAEFEKWGYFNSEKEGRINTAQSLCDSIVSVANNLFSSLKSSLYAFKVTEVTSGVRSNACSHSPPIKVAQRKVHLDDVHVKHNLPAFLR